MEEPHIAQKEPYLVAVKEGKTYAWCACGLSKRQPLCDGSHTGGPFTPIIFRAVEDKELAFCGCKQTKTPPYCDGSHVGL